MTREGDAVRQPLDGDVLKGHLKVLKQAGLVREIAVVTRRIYHIDPRGIVAMREWPDKQWCGTLAAFQQYADDVHEREGYKRASPRSHAAWT